MPLQPNAEQSEGAEKDSARFDKFSGLRNTISKERLGSDELLIARNVDLDDAGQLRRRRGYHQALIGRMHSLYQVTTHSALVVKDGMLCMLYADYTTRPLLAGIGPRHLSYARVGERIFFSSMLNSGVANVSLLTVAPWGRIVEPTYQPGLDPAPQDWWYSPVADTENADGLGPVGGRLLGPPPPGSCIALYNGRIYIARGRELWATLPMNHQWVDKTKGYRFYEDDIVCLGAVKDGLYVGTRSALYFVEGVYGEEKRIIVARSGCIEGTMAEVPGEMVTPEGRRRPDIPQQNSAALAVMTNDGMVVCMEGGTTYNLTRTSFKFPVAGRGALAYREQDGIGQLMTTLDSGGTPADTARVGDYVDAQIIRAADLTGSKDSETILASAASGISPAPLPVLEGDEIVIRDLSGAVIFQGVEE